MTVQFPVGLHDEMAELLAREGRWFDRQEFIKEAVREKIDRHRSQRPGLHPAAAQVIERTKAT